MHLVFNMVFLCQVTAFIVCTILIPPDSGDRVINDSEKVDSATSAMYNNVTKLYDDLLTGYDKRVKPRIIQTDAVTVKFLFKFSGVTEFITASQKLSVLGLFYFQWIDELLSWDTAMYNGIRLAKFPILQVWTPTMVLNKAFDGAGIIGHKTDSVYYTDKGDATWVPEGIFTFICDVKTKFYPFDRQSCKMTIYATDASSNEVNLEPSSEGVNTELHQENSEWKLVGIHAIRVDYFVAHLYDIVIELDRRTEFILYSVVSPLILLSILNIGVFIVPIDSGEKGSIAVTLFLSYGIFVSAISNDLPHNSIDVSYFLIYIQILLWYSVFAVIYSFTESWIYANHADDIVNVCTVFKRKSSNKQGILEDSKINLDKAREVTMDNVATSVQSTTTVGKITWKELLRRIDAGLFIISIFAVSISTSVFFLCISRRNNI